MKTHGEILRELSHEQHISREEIQDAFGKNNAQAVYNLFKKETFSRPEVVVACMLLKVPPSVFGEKENFFETRRFQDFVKGLRGDLSVDSKLAYDESFSFDQLSYEKTEDSLAAYQRFVEHYFESLASFVKEARESIDVMAFLSYKRFPYRMKADEARLKIYAKVRRDYFLEVEEHLAQHPEIIYRRIMQIDVDDKMGRVSQWEHVARAIRIMNPETFRHTLACYRAFQDRPGHFQLYLAVNFVRPFTYIIVDKKAILTEYDRYEINGESRPDLRFINRSRAQTENEQRLDEVHKLIHTHQIDIKRVISKNQDWAGENGISEGRFKQSLMVAVRHVRDKERRISQEIQSQHRQYDDLLTRAKEAQDREQVKAVEKIEADIQHLLAEMERMRLQQEEACKDQEALEIKRHIFQEHPALHQV